jgi:glycosyltransferase involved in cell wall biosynthesis
MVMQLPPPYHGHSFMCELARQSLAECPDVGVHTLPIRFNADMTRISRFSLSKILILIRTMGKLIVELLVWRPDHVYYTPCVSGRWPMLRDMALVLVVKGFRVPVVHHLHGLGIQACISRRPWMRRWFRFLFRNSAVICLGTVQALDVRGVVDGAPFILPNGIPDGDSPLPRVDSNSSDPVRLFYISHLMTAKGILDFVEMLGRLSLAGIPFSADIAGGNGDVTREALQRRIDGMGLAHQVRVHGEVRGNTKHEMFAGADLFVFPSRFQESFGLVLLEAMRAGIPVVASSVGGVPEIVEDGVTGRLYPSGNIEALTQCVQDLMLNAELRQRMGRSARERFLSKYSSTEFECGFRSIMRSVVYDK